MDNYNQFVYYAKTQILKIWGKMNLVIDSNNAYTPPLLTNTAALNNSLYRNSDNNIVYKNINGTTTVLGSGGGGGTIILTTTGTTGVSTLVGTTLNIPVYQGQLTLTTTGSGAAT